MWPIPTPRGFAIAWKRATPSAPGPDTGRRTCTPGRPTGLSTRSTRPAAKSIGNSRSATRFTNRRWPSNDKVFVVSELLGMTCLDSKAVSELWVAPGIKQFLSASPTRVYACDNLGRLTVLDINTGSRVATMPLAEIALKVCNSHTDRVYLAGDAGVVAMSARNRIRKPAVYTPPPPAPPEIKAKLRERPKNRPPSRRKSRRPTKRPTPCPMPRRPPATNRPRWKRKSPTRRPRPMPTIPSNSIDPADHPRRHRRHACRGQSRSSRALGS